MIHQILVFICEDCGISTTLHDPDFSLGHVTEDLPLEWRQDGGGAVYCPNCTDHFIGAQSPLPSYLKRYVQGEALAMERPCPITRILGGEAQGEFIRVRPPGPRLSSLIKQTYLDIPRTEREPGSLSINDETDEAGHTTTHHTFDPNPPKKENP